MIIKSKFEGYVDGVRLYPFKDSGSPPPAPDPNVVSSAQTASNQQTARTNAQLNRVNQYTPYGNLTYSQSTPAGFDQAGYDKALAAYNAKKSAGAAQPYAGAADGSGNSLAYGGAPTEYGAGQPSQDAGPAPTRDQFTTPGSDQWNATITLDPAQQKLLESDNRIKTALGGIAEQGINRVGQSMAQPMDTSHLTSYGNVPVGGGFAGSGSAQNSSLGGGAATVGMGGGAQMADKGGDAQKFTAPNLNYVTGLNGGQIQNALPNNDYSGQRSNVENAIYSRLNPQLQRDRNMLDQKLANQGIMPGSEAYKTAVDESDRQANDARMQAVLAGGQEQSRLAGLDLQAGQFANNAQAQGFGQQNVNANLNNTVNDTKFNQAFTSAGFNNATQQQNWAQQLAAIQANNAAINQNFQNELQGTAMNNAANSQNFQQQLAGTQANNQAQQQNFTQGLAANNQNYSQQAQSAQMSNQQRQQQLQEAAYLRGLPLNELNALRTGAQVTNPSFSPQPQVNMAGTDVAGNIMQGFNNQMGAYNSQVAQNNAMTNGLFSLGGAALMSPAGSLAGLAAAF